MALIRRFSWVLGLAGLALIGAGLSTAWLLDAFTGPAPGFLASGALAVVAWLALDWDRVRRAVRSRAFAHDTASGLIQALVLLIAVVLFVLAERHDTTWDLTRDRVHALSDHTHNVLGSLTQPVRVLAFFRDGSDEQRRAEPLLRRFDDASTQLTVEWIDPLANPLRAQEHQIASSYGTVILTQGERTQRLEGGLTEEALTQRLVVVQSSEDHRVCWALGHNEADPDDDHNADGLGSAVLALEGANHQVTRSIIPTEGIDRACEALVIARPRTEWLPFEREALAAYLAQGGRALILLDPAIVPDFAHDLERFGVQVGDDVVLDINPRNRMMGVEDPTAPVLTGQGIVHHPITRGLAAAVMLRFARSVSAIEGREGLLAQDLLRTSEMAWAETGPLEIAAPDEGHERIGEVPVAAAVQIVDPEVLRVVPPSPPAAPLDGALDLAADLGRGVPADFQPAPGGRLVVIGDSDFASNQFLTLGNNRDLFLNAIAWLLDEEDQIGERPATSDTLEITELGAGLLCLVTVLLVPGAAATLAALTLIRRRFL